MKYYHGSQNGNLTKLSLDKSVDGYVYLTPDYNFAVLYAGSLLRFWKYDFEQQKLIIREVVKDGLKKMYKNKPCYIYSTEELGEHEEMDVMGRKTVRMQHDVELTDKQYIPDAYEKIIELYNQGKIIIWFWEDYSEEQKIKVKQNVIDKFKPHMEEFKEKFKPNYDLVVELFPELEID
ncbi:MAG: hypothetical protein IKM43_01245 [Clostridia bacterium]|nr:hypothetical protein [Clostridia bacterium]